MWKLERACRQSETPVHLGAVEMVAILGEYHTLYFVRLSSVTEMHFRSLPFQIGDKHVPVSTSADLRFKDVVKLVLCLIRLFQSVTFDILLAVCHVQAVFQGKFLADTGVA